MDQYIDLIIDGKPSASMIVSIQNEAGESITTGKWLGPEDTGEPWWRFRLNVKPGLNALSSIIDRISTGKGFTPPSMANLPQKLMLSVSELSEAMEEHRKNRGLHYIADGKPEGILVELADSIIRNLHMMHSLIEQHPEVGMTVEDVIMEKIDFNRDRPTMHGGNSY